MAEKREADKLEEASSSVEKKPNQPKRVKWDIGWVNGEYKSISTNRKYDPVSNRAIVKPRGPQGNKPQNVKGVMPGWDFYEHQAVKNKYTLMNIEQDAASLQGVIWEDSPALRYISHLQHKIRVPTMSIVIFSGGVLLRMQILIRDAVKYDVGGHFLECHFVEGRGPKHCLTFRSFLLSLFVKYFVSRFESETAFNALMDEDAEGEDEDFFNGDKGGDSGSSATAKANQRPNEANSASTHFALDILSPGRTEETGYPLSEELNPTKLKRALTKLPGGTAFNKFPTEAFAKAKEFTGWSDFDNSLGAYSIEAPSEPDESTQFTVGPGDCDGVSVACEQETTSWVDATSTTNEGNSPDAAIVLPKTNEMSRNLECEPSSLSGTTTATLAESSAESPNMVLDSEASTQTANASSVTAGSTAEVPIVIIDDDEAFTSLPKQAPFVPLPPDATNDKDVDQQSVDVDYSLFLVEPPPNEAEDWLDIWEQERAKNGPSASL